MGTLAILHEETENDEQAEANEQTDEGADAAEEVSVLEVVVVEDPLHRLRLDVTELRDHHRLEAVPHGREIHQPGDVSLRRLLEDAWQRNHVTSEQVEWHIDDRCESDGRSLVVEQARQRVTHGGRRLDHEHEHEVVGEELGELVVEPDGEVGDQQEEERNEAHDWNLGDKLGRSVNPNVVHAGVALTHVDGLLSLEYNNSWLEIEEHLHDCHEVNSTSHVFHGLRRVVVVDLPEGAHHEDAHDDRLGDLGSRQSGLALRQRPTPMHQLRQLHPVRRFVLNGVGAGHFGRREPNHPVFGFHLLLEQGVVVAIQVIKLFFVFLLLGVVDGQQLHEVVGGVGELGHGSVDLLEVLDALLGVTLVHYMSVCHQNQLVEVEEGLGGWRVDRAHDSFTLGTSQPLEEHTDAQGLEGVKAGGGLVQQHNGGVGNELYTDGASLALAT